MQTILQAKVVLSSNSCRSVGREGIDIVHSGHADAAGDAVASVSALSVRSIGRAHDREHLDEAKLVCALPLLRTYDTGTALGT